MKAGRVRCRQQGFVLVFVMGALALIALMVGRFAQRIDALRAQTATLQVHADQQLQQGNALAAALYLVSTEQRGPGGFGPLAQPRVLADGRPYRLPDGGEVRLQDGSGLLPLNMADRETLLRILTARGLPLQVADVWFDVLQDYLDTDNLKRLNGAEAQEYAALDLPAPRNDWLVSTRELGRMPGWRDRPELAEWVASVSSPTRAAAVNPNTAPLELLAAMMPQAPAEQLQLFDRLRRQAPFLDGARARATTGLRLDDDRFRYFVGADLRLTVSSRGSPRAVQYNLTLTPNAPRAPWFVTESHAVSRQPPSEEPDRASPFPLALDANREPGDAAVPADPGRTDTAGR